MHIATFVFNPFQENTFIVYDDTKECLIFDPGCSNNTEEQELVDFIEENQLKPVKLINTHCHVDHIFGNYFIASKYGLDLEMHEGDKDILVNAPEIGKMYGVNVHPSPEPKHFLNEGDTVKWGSSSLSILHTPGHSPGGICFYNEKEKVLIAGDVLFLQSIGRADLPGGDFNTLINSIQSKLMVLPDEVTVYPGHGPATTIGHERVNNPFL